MPATPAVHDSFTLTRVYRHPPARVFAAFATEEGKRRWFSSPREDWEWELLDRRFDFRIGGTEVLEARFPSGKHSRFDATFHDIVPDRRIVYACSAACRSRSRWRRSSWRRKATAPG